MAKTRNERRRAAKARLAAKTARIAKAELARQAQERKEIVNANLSSARPGRSFYKPSTMSSFASMSHRGYVCRA